MDYQSTLAYLYERVPMFQQVGGTAYKPGLKTTHLLDEYFGHPHRYFKSIHVAGTNGKGSCSHTIAAVLQSAGYRVGLYTSPHLMDFRERIRINGEMIPEQYVVDFVETHRTFFEPLHPSFFELTTAMAFRYFADQQVEIAVIEAGMGGRLDCTNIIHPDLCIITNIALDHMQYLGSTPTQIAKEKAGIIKSKIPVVIGRAAGAVRRVFTLKAKEMEAPITYAQETRREYTFNWLTYRQLQESRKELLEILKNSRQLQKLAGLSLNLSLMELASKANPRESLQALDRLVDRRKDVIAILGPDFLSGLFFELNGSYQTENILTILSALKELKRIGYHIRQTDFYNGFANVCEMTGLMGRWQKLHSYPDVVCDTGHNADGIEWIAEQLSYIRRERGKQLHIVFGMVADKDVQSVLQLLPQEAVYYFTKASVNRALDEYELQKMAAGMGLHGNSYPTVLQAVQAAKENCLPKDFIFVGGSNFIVADLLANRDALNLY